MERGGCETPGDLFPNEEFISWTDAQNAFGLDPGQFLHHTSLASTVKEIWTTFPAVPIASKTLEGLIAGGGGRHLISLFYQALTPDGTRPTSPARAAWETELEDPITDVQWDRKCVATRTASSNARLKLAHFNFLHRTYLTPTALHYIDRTRSADAPDVNRQMHIHAYGLELSASWYFLAGSD